MSTKEGQILLPLVHPPSFEFPRPHPHPPAPICLLPSSLTHSRILSLSIHPFLPFFLPAPPCARLAPFSVHPPFLFFSTLFPIHRPFIASSFLDPPFPSPGLALERVYVCVGSLAFFPSALCILFSLRAPCSVFFHSFFSFLFSCCLDILSRMSARFLLHPPPLIVVALSRLHSRI